MIDMKEIEKMDNEAIERKVIQMKEDLLRLKMQKATSGVDKPHLFKEYKKGIARLLTVGNQKKN